MFVDEFNVGVLQIHQPLTIWIITPVVVPTLPRGKSKKYPFKYEYYFAQVSSLKGFTGAQVLQEGEYVAHNCLFYYLDVERKYPVTLTFNAMLKNLTWKMGVEYLTLENIIENLDNGESFRWIVFGEYKRPDTLGDVITNLEISIPDSLQGFLKCQLNKPTTNKPLKDRENFKILFEFTKNDSYVQFLKDKTMDVQFKIYGKAYRVVNS
jgi:hypothetical protein